MERSGLSEFCFVHGMMETGGADPVHDGLIAGVCALTGHALDYGAGAMMEQGLGVSSGAGAMMEQGLCVSSGDVTVDNLPPKFLVKGTAQKSKVLNLTLDNGEKSIIKQNINVFPRDVFKGTYTVNSFVQPKIKNSVKKSLPSFSPIIINSIEEYKKKRPTGSIIFKNYIEFVRALPVPTKEQFDLLPVANSKYSILLDSDSEYKIKLDNGNYIRAYSILILTYNYEGKNRYNYYFVEAEPNGGQCWISNITSKVITGW